MNLYTTTVRMLHSGRIHRHCELAGSEQTAIDHHNQLVREMADIVHGTLTQSRSQQQWIATIFVRGAPLIEISGRQE